MSGASRFQDSLSLRDCLDCSPMMNDFGCQHGDPSVAMFGVVPGEERPAEDGGLLDGEEATGEAGMVLQGFELCLGERIVIADLRPAQRTRDAEVGEQLLRAVEARPDLLITIDIDARTLSAPDAGIEVEFPLDDATRERFLKGLDDIGITLQNVCAIDEFESSGRSTRGPVTTSL